ncbi:hypothetical protein [uncultured Bacteroides sp.]|jgi:hypothetical protein|uniref:CdiA C-terminal domain-containing protein n=1 Tax=uncultured Bacteroides sp. TaxID=162156 RepID=UPI0020556BC9|nr:hypothetical protein [uncultured Bacteroides sp.]DAT67827.1 MAG TPA: CDI toxin-like protein [Caudoviricetes sp.]
MAKIDEDKFKRALFQRTEGYAANIRAIYQDVVERLISLVLEIEPIYDSKKMFVFADYPTISDKANVLLRELYSRVYQTMQFSIVNEWEQSNLKSNELVRSVFGKNAIDNKHFARFFERNKKAMDTFFSRKSEDGGLNLSQRIWKYEGQFRQEMEMAIDCHIGEGMSANVMATKVKQYLNEPDKLFRRVRDKRGELVLSKNAKAYHPGRGQYRSSYRNAQRLARSEPNIAYRTADHERWLQLDFVVGIEIKLSKNHPEKDICDKLAGRYPKDFIFKGWHSNCMCHAISVLASDDEIDMLTDKILAGEDTAGFKSKNEVTEPPSGFYSWMQENEDRIEKSNNRGTLPYWIKDNPKYTGVKVEAINTGEREEIRKKAKEKYQSYDNAWTKAYFDEYSGGFNVYHQEHQFTNTQGGGDAEKIVGKLLAKNCGKHVEFLPENGKGKGMPDMKFDGVTWDVKYIDNANENTIRTYIKDARKADRAIFYFTNDKYKDLRSAINREVGRFKAMDKVGDLPDIYYMDKGGLLKLLWKK